MTPLRHPSTGEPIASNGTRHAHLNSVSTRIILCVFVSTLLTALIVSWLSVGAIHNDVRSRVGRRSQMLLAEQSGRIEAWHARTSSALASSAAIGTPWHAALMDALDSLPALAPRDLHWVSDGTPAPEFSSRAKGELTLPPPPPELASEFERLTLHPVQPGAAATGEATPGCLSVRLELVRATSDLAGTLVGCLSHETLSGLLQPPASDFRGLRLLLADATGKVTNGAGARADTRIGARLPMARLFYPADGRLADYEDDAGNRLIGGLAPIERTDWFLVAEAEHAHAFSPAIEITNQIFVVDVCIILLFSVLAFKITLAIMQPIEALSEGAQRIAAGDIAHQIPQPANDDDELGLLTRTFNDMMRKLRSNQEEIEEDRIRLEEKNEELQRANEILAQLSITDGLTKLHNHRYFQDHLTREIKRVSRTQAPLSMILIDIDDFKLLNDTHGHAAGDDVLMALAAIMNDSARESDLIARYGGEEFVILLPNTDLAGAVHLAEKIRISVEETRLIIGEGMKPINITISLGVAAYSGNRRDFFAEADRALYQAKASGKNCVIIAGSEPQGGSENA
jgi:diguanylate cyclase (GGDEF)-like protein